MPKTRRSPKHEQLRLAAQAVLSWASEMGGWDAPCWNALRKALRGKDPAPLLLAAQDTLAWATYMGSWEAPCWNALQQAVSACQSPASEQRPRAVCPHCGAPLIATLEILVREVPLYLDGDYDSRAGIADTKSFRVFCSGCNAEHDESEYAEQVEAHHKVEAAGGF